MPDIDFIRADIEHRRRQVQRLRGEMFRNIQLLCRPAARPDARQDRSALRRARPAEERTARSQQEQGGWEVDDGEPTATVV